MLFAEKVVNLQMLARKPVEERWLAIGAVTFIN